MKLLVIGGTAFLGRHTVEEALRRGYQVTTFNRGLSGPDRLDLTAIHGDRGKPASLDELRRIRLIPIRRAVRIESAVRYSNEQVELQR